MRIQSLLLCAESAVTESGQCQLTGAGIDLISCPGFPCTIKVSLFVRLLREDHDPNGQPPFKIALIGPSAEYEPTIPATYRIRCARGENHIYDLNLTLYNSGLYRLEGSSPLSKDEAFFLFVAEQADATMPGPEDQGYDEDGPPEEE